MKSMTQKKFIINLSGHPVDQKKHDGRIIRSEKVQIPPECLIIPERLYQFLNDILFKLFQEKQLRIAGERGRLSYILPGMSQAAGIVLAIHHGKFGHFPKVFYFIRRKDEFSITDQCLELQNIREKARIDRTFTTN